MKTKPKTYTGAKISVTFDNARCIHAAECANGLPQVFDPKQKPWVNTDGSAPDQIARVIERCPSGALHYERHDGGAPEAAASHNELRVEKDGPIYASGNIRLVDPEGTVLLEDTRVALCRCGASENKPLCDGAHERASFAHAGTIDKDAASSEGDATGVLEITVRPDGPLTFTGGFRYVDHDGNAKPAAVKGSMCRCGQSKVKPYCDGTHKEVGFVSD